jgi:hypothetical protein
MNNTDIPVFMEPQWFVPMFAAMWFGVTGLLSHVGGWANLAAKFRAAQDLDGERFRFVSGSMGKRFLPVNYANCLFVTVGAEALQLSIFFPFRFQSPPLVIPWSEIESVAEKKFLLVFRYITITLKSHWPQINLNGRAGGAVHRAFVAYSSMRSNHSFNGDVAKATHR